MVLRTRETSEGLLGGVRRPRSCATQSTIARAWTRDAGRWRSAAPADGAFSCPTTLSICFRLWGTNIRSRPESRELVSPRAQTPAAALGTLVDLLRNSPSVSRVVQAVLSGGTGAGIGAADFHEKAGPCQVSRRLLLRSFLRLLPTVIAARPA